MMLGHGGRVNGSLALLAKNELIFKKVFEEVHVGDNLPVCTLYRHEVNNPSLGY